MVTSTSSEPRPTSERRRYARRAFSAGVMFDHLPSRREFPARCVDISDGGLQMLVPASAPVQAGHAVHLRAGPASKAAQGSPDKQGSTATVVFTAEGRNGEIVRVDRTRLTQVGQVVVGVRYV